MKRGVANPLTITLGLVLLLSVPASAAPTNLGVAVASALDGDGRLSAFALSEAEHATDFNADGDMLDEVLHAYDSVTGVHRNLRLAVHLDEFVVSGSFIACLVSEAGQGGLDSNGDFDTLDAVVHTHDVLTGTTRNLGVSGMVPLEMKGNLLAIVVPEADQGAQLLNPDTDATDLVLHIADANTGVVTNLAHALALGGRDTWITPPFVAWRTCEASQGGMNLNGDGDSFDEVVHVHDTLAGVTTNVALAGDFAIDYGRPRGSLGGSFVVISASEIQQGMDLNGDGDMLDFVAHTHDAATGVTQSLGLTGLAFVGRGSHVVVPVDEGTMDLNGDGDTIDTNVLVLHDLATGIRTNLGFDGLPASIGKRWIMATVFEATNSVDINGDGDELDFFAVEVDTTAARLTLVKVASGFVMDGRYGWGFVNEFSQGIDLNGDGVVSILTNVVVTYDAVTDTWQNSRVAASRARSEGFRLSIVVDEAEQGIDLNLDTDQIDDVHHLMDIRTGVVRNLGLAAVPGGGAADRWSRGTFLFQVDEAAQGAVDLNLDGDSTDHVLFRVP